MVHYICANSSQNVTNPSRVKERTRNTVIQCLTLNYDLESTLVKYTHWLKILTPKKRLNDMQLGSLLGTTFLGRHHPKNVGEAQL